MLGQRFGGRSLLKPDLPSNAEYQKYLKWESSGGEPGTREHKEYLKEKGEL
jgi:hypothetical protein